MDSCTQGAVEEFQTDDMREFFPVCQDLGIRDGRQGKDHEPHFDLYDPNEASFAEVRGERVFNCRCAPNPIDKYTWAKLVAQGDKIEQSW
jgi:hypothetical protein